MMGFFDFFKTNKTEPTKAPTKKAPEDRIEKSYNEMVDKFVAGEFSGSFESNIMLKKGERLIMAIPEISLCEERAVKIKGSHQGFSVRIAKGLSYRFGTFEGGKEKKVTELDTGTFTLTNKRLVFSGDSKSLEYPLSKIVTIDPLDEGIRINRSGKTKMEYFYNTTNVSITQIINPDENDDWDKTEIQYVMNGIELKTIIQKLVQE